MLSEIDWPFQLCIAYVCVASMFRKYIKYIIKWTFIFVPGLINDKTGWINKY